MMIAECLAISNHTSRIRNRLNKSCIVTQSRNNSYRLFAVAIGGECRTVDYPAHAVKDIRCQANGRIGIALYLPQYLCPPYFVYAIGIGK